MSLNHFLNLVTPAKAGAKLSTESDADASTEVTEQEDGTVEDTATEENNDDEQSDDGESDEGEEDESDEEGSEETSEDDESEEETEEVVEESVSEDTSTEGDNDDSEDQTNTQSEDEGAEAQEGSEEGVNVSPEENEDVVVYKSIPVDEDSQELLDANTEESSDEFDNDLEDNDNLTASIEQLQGIHRIVTMARENGGLDATSAALMNNHLNAIVGSSMTRAIVPSTESFGALSSRTLSTESSERSIGEMIKAGVKKGLDMLLSLIESGKRFFKNLFSSTRNFEKNAEEFGKRAADANGREIEIPASTMNKILGGGKSLSEKLATLKGMVDTLKEGKEFKVEKNFTGQISSINFVEAAKNGKLEDQLKVVLGNFLPYSFISEDGSSLPEAKELKELGLDIKASKTLLGNVVLVRAIAPKDGDFALLGKQTVRKIKGEETAEETASKMSGFKSSDVTTLVGILKDIAGMFSSENAAEAKLDSMIADVKKAISSADNDKAVSELPKEAQNQLQQSTQIVRTNLTSILVANKELADATIKAAKAMSNICDLSLSGKVENAPKITSKEEATA